MSDQNSEALNRLAGEAAHELARRIIAAGLTRDGMSEGVGWSAPLPELGLRVVVHVELVARPLPMVKLQTGTEIEDCTIQAAPGPDEPPVTVKILAELAGYAYTPYFREAVNRLIDCGVLVKIRGKVRKGTVD